MVAGLGAALALRFATDYKIALIARSAEIIENTAGQVRTAGGIAVPIQGDATVAKQIRGDARADQLRAWSRGDSNL